MEEFSFIIIVIMLSLPHINWYSGCVLKH